MKAARKICQGWVKPSELPSNAEIRDEIQRFAFLYEGESRFERLKEMRLEAYRMMKLLWKYRPKLIGSTLTGHIREGSDIDLHVFASTYEAIASVLESSGMLYDVEHKHVRKHGEERIFTHIHVEGSFPIELTVYDPDKLGYAFKSSITGKAMERMTLPQYEQFLEEEYPGESLEDILANAETQVDRFLVFRSLLVPLGKVKQSKKYHPEGDVLYHSLQVFDLACDELPYDEEFLLAALLHDVGKGIDPYSHVEAGLEALCDFISPRTAWFIQYHMEAHRIKDGTIGARARRRLVAHDDFDELMLLEECDRNGREPGVEVPDLDEALDYIEGLSRLYE